MVDAFRDMCAELLADYDNCHYRSELSDRARTLLDQPEPEVEATPNNDDAWFHELLSEIARVQHVAAGEGQGPRFDLAEAVARWCRPTPQPPAVGEVAELVARLHRDGSAMSSQSGQMWWDLMASSSTAQRDHLNDITRAADLLQRQHPQPVPVSEHPWERERWCDEQGRCWLRRKHEEDGVTWRLMAPASVFDDAVPIYYAEALPAHALPTP